MGENKLRRVASPLVVGVCRPLALAFGEYVGADALVCPGEQSSPRDQELQPCSHTEKRSSVDNSQFSKYCPSLTRFAIHDFFMEEPCLLHASEPDTFRYRAICTCDVSGIVD